MVTTATSSTTPANAATQHLRHQNLDSIQRTRHVLGSVIRQSSTRDDPLVPPNRASPQSNHQQNRTARPAEPAAPLPSSFLFNKTWNIHKTTPFYNFDKRQWTQYEGELLTYIAANARGLSSSTLAAPSQSGVATIVNRTGPFPGQIDSSGNNLVETMDDPGDIKRVEFQSLHMNDTVQDLDEERLVGMAHTDSIVITITVRPKGKVRDQPYYCVIVPDQRQSKASSTQDNAKQRPVELHYLLPQAIVGLKTISVSLAPDDVRQLFVSRVEDSSSGILDGIEAHCSDSMKIDFSRLVLARAGCSSWYIASEGKVKT
ncbi:hypothetical protein BGW39_009192 [Mortierella sp. 14UC]|nr:hypothetical protein BGW39_009192 [Mortierella sp. 14UC]